jgi:dienelactone hydrolase
LLNAIWSSTVQHVDAIGQLPVTVEGEQTTCGRVVGAGQDVRAGGGFIIPSSWLVKVLPEHGNGSKWTERGMVGGAMTRKRLGRRWVVLAVALAAVLLPLVTFGAATATHLALPAPSGAHAIGRLRLAWVDQRRAESVTPDEGDRREVIAEVWYPAQADGGSATLYVPELDRIADALVGSGELGAVQAWGLRFVRAHGRMDAAVAATPERFPVVVLSPGGATNAEFYASFAEDLASLGYVVIGLNHPYDVAAVALQNGTVATYSRPEPPRAEYVETRVAERVADIRFALDRLAELEAGDGPLGGRLDLDRVGVMGHSLGGIAAAQACVVDPRLDACLNLDGVQGGGPFSVRPGGAVPAQPFLFVTKETSLAPPIEQLFVEHVTAARIVIAGAAHGDFSDGPLFEPSLNPFTRPIDRTNASIRVAIRDFFGRTLA